MAVWVYVWVKFERQRGTGGELRSKGHKRGQKTRRCTLSPEGLKKFGVGGLVGGGTGRERERRVQVSGYLEYFSLV